MPSIPELVLFWRFEISVKTKSSVTGVKWKLKSADRDQSKRAHKHICKKKLDVA